MLALIVHVSHTSRHLRPRSGDFDPIPSDEPAGLGGSDTAPNPVEQVLGALGKCLAVGYAANAPPPATEACRSHPQQPGTAEHIAGLIEWSSLRTRSGFPDSPQDRVLVSGG